MVKFKYFELSEFTCNCGCGFNNIDIGFVKKLDQARKTAGIPFKITSGCRCKVHNENIKGSPNSSHLKGFAADIYLKNNNHRFRIVKALINVGFDRFSLGKNYVHVDCDLNKMNRIMEVK